jgi:CRP-like cAMP-binding protein
VEDLAATLAKHPFFQGMEAQHLETIAQCASPVNFPAGQYLFREEEEAGRLFVINYGKVAVEVFRARRGPITIHMVDAGQVLGLLWFHQPYHWRADGRAVELTRAIALDIRCLQQKCEEDHDLGYELLKRYAHDLTVHFRGITLKLLDMHG